MKRQTAFLFFALSLLSILSFRPAPPHRDRHRAGAINKELLLKLVNEARRTGVQCGSVWHPPAPPVAWNSQLEAAALDHSADMFRHNYFSHIESDGSTANIRIERRGYVWMAYGENIGFGYTSEQEVVDGWLKSPGHCKNIMNPQYQEMGVARAGDYWTQDFARK
ncbi:MAG: hypothetical protein JWP27_525 [Flaviaesturariibacter sp.]|nr:hypothetical protein [Flaviaesturariibacter sp.]